MVSPRNMPAALRARGGGCCASKDVAAHAASDAPSSAANDAPSPQRTIQSLDAEPDEAHSEVMEELREIDNRLVEALQREDIRLLRTEWLLSRPAGYILQNRQELEALERDGTEPAPLLSADEAFALIHRADRSVAVLSHGWLTAKHCDPCGARVVVVRVALEKHKKLVGMFWGAFTFPNAVRGARGPRGLIAHGPRGPRGLIARTHAANGTRPRAPSVREAPADCTFTIHPRSLARACAHARPDFCSLYQWPRTEQQDAAFKRSLGVMVCSHASTHSLSRALPVQARPMNGRLRCLVHISSDLISHRAQGDLYASAVGTTVLQHKEIPPRPSEFNGVLRLGDLAARNDERAIRAALRRFGEVVGCVLEDNRRALVYFAEHAAAAAAVAAGPTELCGWLALEYNERPYPDRGWCAHSSIEHARARPLASVPFHRLRGD